MAEQTWRDRFRPIIACILAEAAGCPEKEIRRALREAWPGLLLGERARWPYKAWLREIREQRHPKAPKRPTDVTSAGQGVLFEEAA